jgi:hypothetical protein
MFQANSLVPGSFRATEMRVLGFSVPPPGVVGRQNRITDPLGNVCQWTYVAGLVASETNPKGKQTVVTYDSRRGVAHPILGGIP